MNTKNLFNIQDKTVVVTGATGVLGGVMARALGDAGAKVVVLGRNADNGGKLERMIIESGGKALFTQADVLKVDDLERAKKEDQRHVWRY